MEWDGLGRKSNREAPASPMDNHRWREIGRQTANTPMLPAGRQSLDRRWLILVVSIFVFEVALFAVVSSMPLSAAQTNSLLNDTQGVVTQMQNEPLAFKATDIFSNNAWIALFEFVPVFGWIRFFTVTFTTGQVISALASTSGVPAVLLLITTFLSPHAWIELMAYAVAVAESLLLVYALLRRRLRAEIPRAAESLALAFLMLLFAAFLEALTVQYSSATSLAGFGYAWVVAVVVVLAFYWAWRKARGPSPPSTPETTSPPGIPVAGAPPSGAA
jgi:uncharacterized membrane protein SpoIIM required for sporulation